MHSIHLCTFIQTVHMYFKKNYFIYLTSGATPGYTQGLHLALPQRLLLETLEDQMGCQISKRGQLSAVCKTNALLVILSLQPPDVLVESNFYLIIYWLIFGPNSLIKILNL